MGQSASAPLHAPPIAAGGWCPQTTDAADFQDERFLVADVKGLPQHTDLTSAEPPLRAAGGMPLSTALAVVAALHHAHPNSERSPVALYYLARERLGREGQIVPVSLRDAILALMQHGVPAEAEWPQMDSLLLRHPSSSAEASAMGSLPSDPPIAYVAIKANALCLRRALALGQPVMCGMTLYSSFGGGDAMPPVAAGERPVGAEAVLIVGYDDARKEFTLRGPWGGYTRVGAEALIRSASDFWQFRRQRGGGG